METPTVLPRFDADGMRAIRRAAWLLDHEAGRVLWANPAAVDLWDAGSLEALLAKDLSGVSASVRTRTQATANAARAGMSHRERWTMYPGGQARTVDVLVSGVRVGADGFALLIEAAEVDVVAGDVRAIEAVRHSSSMLTLFDENGRPLYRNPAAMEAHGDGVFGTGYADAAAGAALWAGAREGLPAQATLAVRTRAGERWHALALTMTADPASGRPARLLDERDVTQAVLATSELARLARHDSLTGLPNRAQFNARAEVAVSEAASGGGAVAIGLLDLDRFKAVNDTLGHAAGDALLVEASRRMAAVLGGGDLLARLGGDEFALLVGGPEPARRAERIGAALVASLARPFALPQGVATIGTSIGFALAPEHGNSADRLLLEADAALYVVKRAGRGAFRLATGDDEITARAA